MIIWNTQKLERENTAIIGPNIASDAVKIVGVHNGGDAKRHIYLYRRHDGHESLAALRVNSDYIVFKCSRMHASRLNICCIRRVSSPCHMFIGDVNNPSVICLSSCNRHQAC